MNMEYLLGIDIGTSGTKTALFGQDGKAVSSVTIEYPLYQPNNGWAEQDPADWWHAARDGIRRVVAESGANVSDIRSVGLSGQMHGLVMLDKGGNVLRRAIIWCDQRTAAECAKMNYIIGDKRIMEITANPAMTGFTAAKILWVQTNEPDIYAKCTHILLPKDYIRYMLTGEFATEVSDAAGMQLMDIGKRNWSDEILSKLNIERDLLGSMHESVDITGEIHIKAAEETGLPVGTIVVGGAGDNAAAAIGTGVVRPGAAFTTLGTSGVVYAVSDEVTIDLAGKVHTLCASVPGKWTVMSCTQAAGLSLQWFRNQCCSRADSYDLMTEMAANIEIGAEGLIYLPYLMGERSPHPDPDCRGVFFGLSAKHTRAHMIRAVMEGVTFSQKECVDVFKDMGVSISDMAVCGGGGKSELWRQMLADLYQCPVSTIQTDEGPALGAAILAGVGAGVYTDLDEACGMIVKRGSEAFPIADNTAAYERYYRLYKKLYLDLKDSYKELSEL